MARKVQKHKFPWEFIIGGFIFVAIMAIQFARVTYDHPKADALELLLNYYTEQLPKINELIYLGSTDWKYAWIFGFIFFIIFIYVYVDYEKNRQSYYGKEKGTAKWNEFTEYTKQYAYPKGKKGHQEPSEGSNDIGNLILASNVYLNMNIRQTFLNDNVCIIGATGTGKTRYYVKPNILQQNTSYIITDPSGELLTDVGMSLMKAGYVVKVFNLNEMEHSSSYNPFRYITSDSDIPILVDCFVKNTTDEKAGKGDQFFDQAMIQLFTSLFYYIYYKEPPERQNFGRVVDLLGMMSVDENNPSAKSKLDLLFDKYEKEDPRATAVTNYKMFKIGAGKTLKSIIISANVRMRPFTLDAVRDITANDTIHLEEIGDFKQAIFIVTPTQIKTYNFLAAMMYTQLFQLMFNKGSNECKNRWQVKYDASCPIHSRVFSNGKEKKEIEKEFAEEWEMYKKCQIVQVERPDITEDDEATVGKYKYAIRNENGETLREYECEEQAKYFMKCVKLGRMERGTIALPSHVHLVLDEFANIGVIPNFQEIVATMRKFSISCTIILQTISQLKEMYKDNADTLMGNCATQLILGTTSQEVAKYVSESLGKTTQKVRNTSYSYGPKGNTSQSWNTDALDLMTPDEVRSMPSDDCIVMIAGMAPFYTKKYPLEQHPNYKYLADASADNIFPYKVYFRTGAQSKKKKEIAKNTSEFLSPKASSGEKTRQAEKLEKVAQQEEDKLPKLDIISELIGRSSVSDLGLDDETMKGNSIDPDIMNRNIREHVNRNGSVGETKFRTRMTDSDANGGFMSDEVMEMSPEGIPIF